MDTKESYLHTIRGSYNDRLRRKVRRLFSEAPKEEKEENNDELDYDLVVGVLEEIYAVGVRYFSITHVLKIADIFGLDDIQQHGVSLTSGFFVQAFMKMGVPSGATAYSTPEPIVIEKLKVRYCSEEKTKARVEQVAARRQEAMDHSA